jgi:hypothetical protein
MLKNEASEVTIIENSWNPNNASYEPTTKLTTVGKMETRMIRILADYNGS